MKYIILAALLLAGCATDFSQDFGPAPSSSSEPSILSKWQTLETTVIIPNPDFTGLTLNVQEPIEDFITCTGSYGNTVTNLGVPSGMMVVQGDAQFGYIQMGNTKYYGMAASPLATECSNLSKETYIYSIQNQVLHLCLENLSYPYCTNYILNQ